MDLRKFFPVTTIKNKDERKSDNTEKQHPTLESFVSQTQTETNNTTVFPLTQVNKIPVMFTDGASRGNPGKASLGVAFFSDPNYVDAPTLPDWTLSKYLGNRTNNFAEYAAIIEGLRECHNRGIKKIFQPFWNVIMMIMSLLFTQLQKSKRWRIFTGIK